MEDVRARRLTLSDEKKALLPYGGSISAPKITVPDVSGFKKQGAVTASNYFQARVDALQREYEELQKLAKDTELIYKARYNFVPIIGRTYYLYYTGEDYILSLIENWNKFEFIGAFIYTNHNVWERMDQAD